MNTQENQPVVQRELQFLSHGEQRKECMGNNPDFESDTANQPVRGIEIPNWDRSMDVGLMCVDSGRHMERIRRTIAWYESRADRGDILAQYTCANMLKEHARGEPDRRKAFEWAERAARNGFNQARILLARMCEEGFGTQMDELRARGLYELAAREDHPDAQWAMACICKKDKDEEKYREWLEKAAQNGQTDARKVLQEEQERRERAERERRKKIEKLYRTAVQDYEKQFYTAAMKAFLYLTKLGVNNARFYLGRMYYLGQGTEPDEKKALELFLEAAEHGHVRAQYLCGQMYSFGEGTPRDPVKGFQWYLKAAEQGDSEAQFNCGLIYRNGSGGVQDPEKAQMWFRKAAEQGNERARSFLVCDDTEGEEDDDFNPLADLFL